MWTLSIHEENKTCLSVSTDHNRGNAALLLNSKHNYFILWLYYTREWMSMVWDSIVIDTKESECLKTLIRWKEVDKFSRKRKKKKKKRTNEHSRNYILEHYQCMLILKSDTAIHLFSYWRWTNKKEWRVIQYSSVVQYREKIAANRQ